MGWSDNRSLINPQVHVQSGDGRRRWDGMVRQQVFDQSTSSRTLWRQTKRMGWDGQTTGLSSIHKFTYRLKTDEEDGIGWSDNRSVINPQIHVQAGDGRRGWDGMVRQQVCDQSTCSRTVWRQTKRMGWDGQTTGL